MVMGSDVATNADIHTFQLAISPKHAVFLVIPEGDDDSQETPLRNDEIPVPGPPPGSTVPLPTQEGEHG